MRIYLHVNQKHTKKFHVKCLVHVKCERWRIGVDLFETVPEFPEPREAKVG